MVESQPTTSSPSPRLALVARTERDPKRTERFLQLSARGLPVWVEDPESATAFASLREAMRMASQLPADVRAFSVPVPGGKLAADLGANPQERSQLPIA